MILVGNFCNGFLVVDFVSGMMVVGVMVMVMGLNGMCEVVVEDILVGSGCMNLVKGELIVVVNILVCGENGGDVY